MSGLFDIGAVYILDEPVPRAERSFEDSVVVAYSNAVQINDLCYSLAVYARDLKERFESAYRVPRWAVFLYAFRLRYGGKESRPRVDWPRAFVGLRDDPATRDALSTIVQLWSTNFPRAIIAVFAFLAQQYPLPDV